MISKCPNFLKVRPCAVAVATCGVLAAAAQQPTVRYERDLASLQLVANPAGGAYWVQQLPDDVYEVLDEDFAALGSFALEDSLSTGTTVRALGEGARLDESQPNFLVERTGEFVLQAVIAADGTLLRRTRRPRYTQTYRLADGRLAIQERDASTGEEALIDLQTLTERGRFPERVVHTRLAGVDLWASRAQGVARVYTSDFELRSEVSVTPARADSTPGFAFGLLGVDLESDGLLDFEIRYADGGGEEAGRSRYRVFNEAGKVYLDTLEPTGVLYAVQRGAAGGDGALLTAIGERTSFDFTGGRLATARSLATSGPTAVVLADGRVTVGPGRRAPAIPAVVYGEQYDLRGVVSAEGVARASGDTAVSDFAFAAVSESGLPFGEAPLAWVSYGDPDDLGDTRLYLTDVEGDLAYGFEAEALRVVESDTAVYLVVDGGGSLRSRRMTVYGQARPQPDTTAPPPPDTSGGTPPTDTTGGTPPPDTSSGSGGDTSSTVLTRFDDAGVSVVPNPASSAFKLLGIGPEPVTVTLLTASGKRAASLRGVRAGEVLPLDGLAAGLYTVLVAVDGRQKFAGRILVDPGD